MDDALSIRPSGRRLASYIPVLLATCLPACAEAGRPLATEDAGVLEPRNCELQLFALRQTGPEGPAAKGVHADTGCGIGWGTQVGLGYERVRQEGEITSAREITGKTSLRATDDEGANLAVAYGYRGTRVPSEGYRAEAWGIKFVATKLWQGFVLHANVGTQRDQVAHSNSTTWAVAVERESVWGPVDLGVEAFGDDREPAWLQLAARFVLIKDRVSLDASFGRQTSSTHPRAMTLGIKITW